MQNDLALLELMMEDQLPQKEIYRPGPYWIHYQKRVHMALKNLGLENFRDEPAIGKGYVDVVVSNPFDLEHNPERFKARLLQTIAKLPKVKKIVKRHQELLNATISQRLNLQSSFYQCCYGDFLEKTMATFDMPDTLHGNTKEIVELNCGTFAQHYLSSLIRLTPFHDLADFDNARTVLEIGGGFGVMMHLLLSRYTGIRKVIYLDIPPMLYVGTQYLRHFYPNAIVDYRDTCKTDRIAFSDNDELEILCICPWQIEQMDAEVDLLINSASFNEMSVPIVQNYGQHMKRLGTKDSRICLMMNKLKGGNNTTSPEQVMAAFEPEYKFQGVVGEVDYSFDGHRFGKRLP